MISIKQPQSLPALFLALLGASLGSLSTPALAGACAAPPPAPIKLGAQAGDKKVILSFGAPNSINPITGYQYSTDNEATYVSTPQNSSPITITQLSNAPNAALVNGTQYTFFLRAVSGNNPAGKQSGASASVTSIPTYCVSSATRTCVKATGTNIADPNVAVDISSGTFNSNPSVAATPTNAASVNGVSYPLGFFTFDVGVAAGGSTNVTLTLPSGVTANGVVKCNSALVCHTVSGVTVGADASGRTTLTYTITDGNADDTNPNAAVVGDPVAPSVSSSAAATSGGGALGWLALIPLGGVVIWRRRRKR